MKFSVKNISRYLRLEMILDQPIVSVRRAPSAAIRLPSPQLVPLLSQVGCDTAPACSPSFELAAEAGRTRPVASPTQQRRPSASASLVLVSH